MDKQEARQAEIDARRNDDVAWRTTVRAEDKNWRETIRAEDREWRLTVRDEDKSWRARTEIVTKRCCALSAAAQSSKPGTSPEAIFALAKLYEEWLDGKRE
jgi:hypothetical protein